MSAVSVRLSNRVVHDLEKLATSVERSKSYLVRKAIEAYLADYVDYQVALDRMRDKQDPIISSAELRKQLGL